MISEDDLNNLEELVSATTPGPWFVRYLDDRSAMNLIAISTKEDTGQGERWPQYDCAEIVAATLIQDPDYVHSADGLWIDNAEFIARARSDVPRLIAEIRRLRNLLK